MLVESLDSFRLRSPCFFFTSPLLSLLFPLSLTLFSSPLLLFESVGGPNECTHEGVETILKPFEILRHARGVYLLVRRDTGEQYVGSANGADGFYGRWCNYADGHGGNVAMKELKAPASAFDVSILEVVGSEATPEHIIEREGLWKDKLGTRVKELKGLNRN